LNITHTILTYYFGPETRLHTTYVRKISILIKNADDVM